MKKIILVSSLFLSLFFIGCGSKDALPEGAKSIGKEALAANNLTGAPNWVLNGGSGEMSAVGIADITSAGLQFARNEALAHARDDLSRQVSVSIEGIISSAVEQTMGDGFPEASVNKYSEQITKQSVSQTLSGTKQKDTWISPDGKQIFVLIALDPQLQAKLKANVKEQVSKDKTIADGAKSKLLERLDTAIQ